ncbi:MAG: hypothetical protein ACC628_15655 [Pirellulaceae bacterium]
MPAEIEPLKKWDRIASELRELAAERRAEEPLDANTIARFLAGVDSEEEQQAVRNALESNEDIRLMIQVVQEVFDGPELANSEPARGTPSNLVWAATDTLETLTGQLCAWVDAGGKVVASGFRELLRGPDPELGVLMSRPGTTVDPVAWKLPVLDGEGTLDVGLVPSDSPGVWLVAGRVESTDHPAFAAESRLEIHAPDGTVELACSVDQWVNDPISLTTGLWELRILWREHVWQVSLFVGNPFRSEDD